MSVSCRKENDVQHDVFSTNKKDNENSLMEKRPLSSTLSAVSNDCRTVLWLTDSLK